VRATVSTSGRSNEWADTIVLCAANSWDDVKLADRHMAENLTAHAPVLYVDPPISHLTRFNNPAVAASMARPHLRQIGPRLARYTPIVPPKPMHPAMLGWTERIVRRELRSAIRSLGADVSAVVTTWLHLDVFGCLGEGARIYWWQDDPAGAAEFWGASPQILAAADERLARSADVVVAVNDDAVARWRGRGVDATFLPNGCDTASFSRDDLPVPSDARLPRPVAGFVGHLNARTDLALLEAVAVGGTSLVLIGPKDPRFEPERFARLVERPNVRYLGPKPFEALPPYLAAMDVGLVPYGLSEFNRWSFPMKALEYLSAGLPVVSTSLPAMQWLDTPLIALTDTPQAFASAVEAVGSSPRTSGESAARRAFAQRHSWAQRADELAGIVQKLSASRSATLATS
jgi:glycosyltransferase involved in cell wall biosynthesis